MIAPDLAIEILSPGQTVGELRLKPRHSPRHGSTLGWIIQSSRKRVDVLRENQKPKVLEMSDTLSGDDVIPGFSIPVAEILGWLD